MVGVSRRLISIIDLDVYKVNAPAVFVMSYVKNVARRNTGTALLGSTRSTVQHRTAQGFESARQSPCAAKNSVVLGMTFCVDPGGVEGQRTAHGGDYSWDRCGSPVVAEPNWLARTPTTGYLP